MNSHGGVARIFRPLLYRPQRTLVLPVVAILTVSALGFIACTPTLECGSWAFTGTPQSDAFQVSSGFTFTPATCGKKCECQEDVITQMVSVYDSDSQTYMFPSSSQEARSIAYG